jgi:hypothetical protein
MENQMNQTRSNKMRRLAFAGLVAALFAFGTRAEACSLGSTIGAKSTALAESVLEEPGAAKLGPNTTVPIFFPGAVQGLWQVTYSSGGQVVDTAFEVFHSDGTEALNDVTPPAEGNVCFGVWLQTGLNTYSVNHPSWTFDGNGNLTGTAVVKSTINLASLNKFTGSSTLSYFDLKGNPGPVYTATLSATRIQPGN